MAWLWCPQFFIGIGVGLIICGTIDFFFGGGPT